MNISRKTTYTIMTLILIISTILASSLTLNAASSSTDITKDVTKLNSADLRDAQLVANTLGITVQEAATHLHLQEVAGKLHAELINNEVDTFGESWIEHSPSFKMLIQFINNGETKIQPYLLKYPELANLIEVRTSKYSYKQLQQIQNQIVSDLNVAGIPADTDIDIQKDLIDISVTDKTNLESALSEKRLTLPENVNIRLTKQLIEDYSAITSPACVPAVNNPSTLGFTLIGGHKISNSSGSTYGTTGFTVYNSYGRYVSTAGHVTINLWPTAYYDINSQIPLYGVGYTISNGLDLGYYASLENMTNVIQDTSTTTRSIGSVEPVASMQIGEWVFKYGQSTGTTFGAIENTNVSGYVRIISVLGGSIAEPGDSGAPCFVSGYAYGIVHGEDFGIYPTRNLLFSPAEKFPNKDNLQVLTSP